MEINKLNINSKYLLKYPSGKCYCLIYGGVKVEYGEKWLIWSISNKATVFHRISNRNRPQILQEVNCSHANL